MGELISAICAECGEARGGDDTRRWHVYECFTEGNPVYRWVVCPKCADEEAASVEDSDEEAIVV